MKKLGIMDVMYGDRDVFLSVFWPDSPRKRAGSPIRMTHHFALEALAEACERLQVICDMCGAK